MSSQPSSQPAESGSANRQVATVPVISLPALRGKHELAPGDVEGESLAHWQRLLVVALGLWPLPPGTANYPFRSLAVPARFAGELVTWLTRCGCQTRLSDAYTDEARMLTFWRAVA